MKKGLIGTFLILGIIFLFITYSKYADNSTNSDTAHSKINNDSDRAQVVNFWKYYDRATDYRMKGQPRKASEFYGRALELDTTHQNTLYYLGNMQMVLGRHRTARKHWKRLIRVNPASARGHSQLGYLFSCREKDNPLYNPDSSIVHFKKALELNREETGPLLQLAKIDLLVGNYDAAKTKLEDVIASNFKSAEALFLKGYLAWKNGNSGDATEFLKKSVSLVNNETSAPANVGEGETESGSSPMLTSSIGCDLYARFIYQLINQVDTSNLSPEDTYRHFEREATPN